ncbi:hypothetical protein L3X38_003660 [Prunus dulcis]|uniref:Uncharacterized protein n=1 Tax=Prunus dulcis TaxID=3755 RepID=A0AAD4ZMJ1_PRUDU|nr:hypothetical protein L3X38_003660 [Prunus dulcis]
MYASSLLARFMHCPTSKHYGTAKRGGSLDDSKTTSGYAFSFGSGVFSQALVKQNCVALSTAEAEYISASEATAQAIWLRFVLEDFGELQTEATPLQSLRTLCFIKRQSTLIRDIFPKPLAKDRFNHLRNLLGVKSAQDLKGSVKL